MDHSTMSDYMAHGFCFSWEPGLVWIHVGSDVVTGLSYYVITAAMIYFAVKRRDVPFFWIFILFALFIFACGTTHFLAAYTVYRPDYWIEGYVKALTALVSVAAAIVFIPKIPQAIVMPSLAKTLSEVQRLGAEQQQGRERLQSLVNVFQFKSDTIQELLDFALNEAIVMTSSKYGYLYYYDEATKQFTLNSWSRGVMDACNVTNPQSRYDLDKTGIWGEAVRQRSPIIVNDFASPDPLKKGYPEGHVHLTRFMTIPLIDNGKIVAVVGVANKDEKYDDADVTQLTLLMESVWKVVERKRVEEERKSMLLQQQGINQLQQSLIAPAPLETKLDSITDAVVRIFNADFCRIWLIRPGDRCEKGCIHAEVHEGPHVCRFRDRCLHLMASSGRYSHTDGTVHRRVPFGCYKIGRVASGEEHKFICNDVQNDPRIHDREWARELGLEAFAGYQLRVPEGDVLGVLALFARHRISADEDTLLDGLGSAVALVIQQSNSEEARKQKEREIEEKNTEMERFIYTVSHDLKSPLVTISSFLGYLETDIQASDADRIREDVGYIRNAAEKMGQLLAELLELSRVGRVVANPVQVSFQDIVQEALLLVAGHISARGVQIDVAESQVILYADRARLVEIWQNLIENACKFMGNQEQPRIEIGVEERGEETLFFVRDNGIGVDTRFHAKIFGLFEKLEASSDGTGLGLALVKRIVELFDGAIHIESPGPFQGSTFLFTLPAALKK